MIKNLKEYCKERYLGFQRRILCNGRLPFTSKMNGFLILNYHSVQKDSNYPFAVSPEDFESQIRYLVNNFKIRTVAEIAEHIIKGENVSDILVGITFDDGYFDNYKYAMPVLQKYDIPAMFFISPYIIDLRYKAFMSWSEIKEAANIELIKFGSHGLCHLPLPVLHKNDVEIEIRKSKSILEDILKTEISFFAFPFGMVHPECEMILRRSGYKAGFMVSLNAGKAINPFMIGRLAIHKENSMPNHFESTIACSVRYYQNSNS
jgi:peptidoglycan/xylan/chitin deacetylase (PgdA/CDA1 family)